MFYPDDRSNTAAIANDYIRTTFTQGDDRSDPNWPMVHQYYPELNGLTKNITTKTVELFMEEV